MRKWVIIVLGFTAGAHASSFVGNGGSQGDVELLVTLMQIQETFQLVQKKAGDEIQLCKCNRMFSGRAVCEPLNSLNEEQGKFCTKSLAQVSPEILRLIENRDKIHIVWTNSSIEVKDGTHTRAADAVANREKQEITINQPRFLAMQPVERVFLLTHELMHFTTLDGKPLEDLGPLGPFGGGDGSRDFINAMAAAAGVMQGNYPNEIKRYRAKLSRSQAWKTRWITADAGAAAPETNYSDAFQFNNYQRLQVGLRYQWTNLGLALAYRSEKADKKVLDTISINEQVSVFGAGVTYRIFPFSDPLTFWGQSHILLQAMAELVKADFNYQEDPIHVDGHASTLGGSFAVNYYIPLFWGLWTYIGAAYEVHPYKYNEANVNLNFNKNLFSEYLGVGYAF